MNLTWRRLRMALLAVCTCMLAHVGHADAASIIGSSERVSQAQIQQSLINNGASPGLAASAASLSANIEDRGGTLGVYNGSCCTGVLQVNQGGLAKYCGCTPQQYANMGVDQQTAVWLKLTQAQMGAQSVQTLQSMQKNGQSLGGQPVDDAMVLSCAQLGPGNCAKTIAYANQTGTCGSGKGVPGADSNGTSICSMAQAINGGGSSTSTTVTQNSDGTTTTNTTVTGLFCDPVIAQQISDSGRQMVDSWTTLAMRPETGYSLLGGQSVLEAAGLMPSGSSAQSGISGLFGNSGSGLFGGGGYAMASCLKNLVSGPGGLNISFNLPSIEQIEDAVLNYACNQVTGLFSQVTSRLSQSVFESFSSSGLIPGLDLGSIGAGGSIGIGQRQAGGGLVNVSNGNSTLSYSPDQGWYQGSSNPYGTYNPSYGSLFGR